MDTFCRNNAILQEKLTSAQAHIERLQKALKDKSDNDRHADEVQRQAQEWQQMAENIGVEQPAEILQRMKVLRDECLSCGEALSQAQGEVKSMSGETFYTLWVNSIEYREYKSLYVSSPQSSKTERIYCSKWSQRGELCQGL